MAEIKKKTASPRVRKVRVRDEAPASNRRSAPRKLKRHFSGATAKVEYQLGFSLFIFTRYYFFYKISPRFIINFCIY